MKNTLKRKSPVFRINNRQKKISINLSDIRKVFEGNSEFFSPPPQEIGVTIVSDRVIRKINRQFLEKDSSTDVISFKMSRKYGEIIISAETALKNSSVYGKTLEKEIIYLIVHGYLHLKNYRDYTPSEQQKMLALQDDIFSGLTEK
ncbi:MAG TPA: rRNA maturation RNase YbeY [bacterium]|nr:rRNA maturation RNase YbeY [bacterium]